jgi:hypothetical protein
VSAADASTKEILWGFIARYMPGADAASQPLLDRLADYAIHYYEDFVKPSKRFRTPDDRERAAMADLAARLRALPAGCQDAELIQAEVYEAGKAAGFEPLRLWFSALYEVLLGQSQGPRFGSFAAIFGLDRTVGLIEQRTLAFPFIISEEEWGAIWYEVLIRTKLAPGSVSKSLINSMIYIIVTGDSWPKKNKLYDKFRTLSKRGIILEVYKELYRRNPIKWSLIGDADVLEGQRNAKNGTPRPMMTPPNTKKFNRLRDMSIHEINLGMGLNLSRWG